MKKPRDRMSPSFSFGSVRKREPAPTPAPEAGADEVAAPSPAGGSLIQWAGGPKATLAVVFTDIVASAALGNKIGNRGMDALRRAHFAAAAGLVDRLGGRVVKTIGDSVMAAFHAATDALDFALAVRAAPGDGRIQLRAGVHVGLVSVEDADLQGSAVSYAARVASAGRGAEIWLSSEAKSHVDQQGEPQHANLAWVEHAGIELKGFVGKHILWSLKS